MSTVAVTNLGGDFSAKKVAWTGLGGAETGTSAAFPEYCDRSFQVSGTFGGATVTIQGTNDGSNWAALTDPQGNALTFSAAKIEAVQESVNQIRPVTSGGTGSDLNVYMIARRPTQLRT